MVGNPNLYSRKYSLTKPAFVLKRGEGFDTEHFIYKITEAPVDIKNARICIIISNKFTKGAVIRSKLKRNIANGVMNILHEPCDIVIIPKKNLLNQSGKIAVDAKKISDEIDPFLSKLVLSGSKQII